MSTLEPSKGTIKFAIYLCLTIAVILIGTLFFSLPFDREPRVTTLDSLGIITNAILTTVLALIYLDMSNTQDDQFSLQEKQSTIQQNMLEVQANQTEILTREHSPIMQLDGLRNIGDDSFILTLSNYGDEPAYDLKIEMSPQLYNWSNRELSPVKTALSPWQTELDRPTEYPDDSTVINKQNKIEQKQLEKEFKFSIRFLFQEDETNIFPGGGNTIGAFVTPRNLLEHALAGIKAHSYGSSDQWIDTLEDDEIEQYRDKIPFNRLRVTLTLYYSDKGDELSKEVADLIAPLDASLEDGAMWEYAMEYEDYEQKLKQKHNHQGWGGYDPIGDKISLAQMEDL